MLAFAVATVAAFQIPHTPSLHLTGANNELYALSTRFAGDVDGDGHCDVLVYANVSSGALPGIVYVRSGLDGSVIYTFSQLENDFLAGVPMDGAGDIDADGYAEVIVGCAAESRARVYSGRTGGILFEFTGLHPDDGFGGSVAGVGDLDRDGHDDVMVGTTFHFSNDPGYARVFSGADGSVLYTLSGSKAGDQFGVSVRAVGDVDGDGRPDFAIGAVGDGHRYIHPGIPGLQDRFWGDDDAGSVTVYSGINGRELYTDLGRHQYSGLGYSIAAAGDVDGDGFDDFVVGTKSNDFPPQAYASIVSGIDGSTILTLPAHLGGSLAFVSVGGAGDLDGDGVPDVLVGARSPGGGAADVVLYSGADGHRLFGYASPVSPLGSVTVDGGRDIDHDGIDDFLIGISVASTGQGFVELYLSGQ